MIAMNTTNDKSTRRAGTRRVGSKPLEGALAMTTVQNTTDKGNALAEAKAHLAEVKRELEAWEIALAATRNPRALEIVHDIERGGYNAVRVLDVRLRDLTATAAVWKLEHPVLAKLFALFMAGAK